MKKLNILLAVMILTVFSANAQLAEVGPYNEVPPVTENNLALFDLLYQYDIGSLGSVGVDGLAGVIYFGGQYWVSEWQSDIIHVLDGDGSFLESFQIPGVTGTRSFTTDGEFIYIGGGSTSIYVIDPVDRTLEDEIVLITGTDAEARMCTYDPTLDGGDGGFWVGDFGSSIISIDMIGIQITEIPAADHNMVIYGGAVDVVSPGGPFLWIHDQSIAGTEPDRDLIKQIDLNTGLPTGVDYSYYADSVTLGGIEALAGGLFISEDVVSGYTTIVGLCQCSPSNQLFGIELIESLGSSDNEISNFSIVPNPANGNTISIETATIGTKQIAVYDILGKQVIKTEISNNELNISALEAGVYMVKVSQNGVTATKKLIKR